NAVSLSNGSASISTASRPVGTHVITAVYTGDGKFSSSTGTLSPNQVVGKANTTTALASSANPSVLGQTVWFTATVSVAPPGSGTPTGSVQFKDGAVNLGSPVAVANRVASISTAGLSVGTHVITAVYGGDGNFNASTGTLAPDQVVGKADTTTALASSANPSVYRQPIDISVTVAPATPGLGTPTGTVLFQADGTPIGNALALTNGSATVSISTLFAGTHTVTAAYSGDVNFNPSIGALAPDQTVTKADTLVAIISNAPNPSVVGQLVTVTFSVLANTPYGGTPTGNVSVTDGTSSCTGTVAAGNCQISFMTAGNTTLTAGYQGDDNYNASPPIAGVGQTVNKANTTTGVSTSANPSVFGQTVWFTAKVSAAPPGSGTLTGSVQFKSDGANIGTAVSLLSGSASMSTAGLLVGTHVITAVYSGDGNFISSTGTLAPDQVVGKANTTTTINSHAPNPSIVGNPVTVNFSVAARAPGAGTPTGSVTLTDGTVQCIAAVASGSCQIAFTSTGTKTLTAIYGGDASFVSSTSAPASHVVNPPLKFFLPMILLSPSGPRPGAWKSTTNDEFNVGPNRDSIQGFAIYVDVPSCGLSHYKITHTTTEPIINNHFSFTGSFYADVTFDSETTAHGYDGLNNYTIPGCGTGSGGPWAFTATWQSSTPLPFAAPGLRPGPNPVDPASTSDKDAHIILTK
ncbi:MAG TPA: Ig-like domain-containing protein, partial [Anaerolineae bacterium]